MIITFGNTAAETLGLKLFALSMPPPEPKTSYIDVPGRDGSIDVSALDGFVHYKDRTITLSFSYFGSYSQWFAAVSQLNSLLLGQKLKLTISDDPGYYYFGRFSVSTDKSNPVSGDIVVTGQCSPYKFKTNVTVVEQDISGSAEITLTNERMPSTPTITTDAEMQLVWGASGENSLTLNAGTHRYTGPLLLEGDNEFTVNGTGHIKFEYQEGAL